MKSFTISRARKIRCDSTRPSCNNCVRRQNDCEYDAVPKRRGPDKRPGTRQRSCKKRPADGSTPMKKKQRKGAAVAGDGSASPRSPGRMDAMGGNSAALEPPASMNMRPGEMVGEAGIGMSIGSGMGYGGGMGGVEVHGRQNMGLRLDMNYMDRSTNYYGSGQLNSSHSHSRTHSTHSTQSFQLQSASASPASSMSHHIYNVRSPELILPKVSLLSL